MKKILLWLGICLFAFNVQAQMSIDDLYNYSKTVTWLGIDFSQNKFIGPATGWGEISTKSSVEMRDKYYPEWNAMILNEPKMFKIAEAIGRTQVDYFTKVTDEANEKTNKREVFSESIAEYQLLTEDDVRKMVKQYNYHGKEGIGLLFIAEGMSKGREEASYWVTFVDMKTKKVILTKRIQGKAGGIGFRNYWAGSIKSAIKETKRSFKKWN